MPKFQLLICDRGVDETTSGVTRFGGAPSVPAGFAWPTCRSCGGPMQFLGELRLHAPERLLSLFMCQNDPGVCSEWEADGGANAAFRFPVEGLSAATPPSEGEVARQTRYGARSVVVESASYDAARADWGKHKGRQRDVLGQIGGEPLWLDGDETPDCDQCGKPMRFAAQLETGPDHETEMNFAGRIAHVFECDCGGGVAKMNW